MTDVCRFYMLQYNCITIFSNRISVKNFYHNLFGKSEQEQRRRMMKEILYNKLVRDKIPQIIEEAGKQCETKILSDTEYLEMLDKKLDEELAD